MVIMGSSTFQPLIKNSVIVSCLSGLSISTWMHGLKKPNLSFVTYVFGGGSVGSEVGFDGCKDC
jgi:hypothetical protein